MSTDLRDLLADLVQDQPDPGIDLDRQIALGRRRARHRTAATAALAGVTVAGVVAAGLALPSGGTAFQTPDPAATPTPTYLLDQQAWMDSPKSTTLSRALADEIHRLVPELAGSTKHRRDDGQYWRDRVGYYGNDKPGEVQVRRDDIVPPGGWLPRLMVSYQVRGRMITPAPGHVEPLYFSDFTVLVGAPGQHVQVSCVEMPPEQGRCHGQERELSDGSKATVHSNVANGKTRYAVRAVRPDGTQIVIQSGINLISGAPDVLALSPDRLLEIAQSITTTP